MNNWSIKLKQTSDDFSYIRSLALVWYNCVHQEPRFADTKWTNIIPTMDQKKPRLRWGRQFYTFWFIREFTVTVCEGILNTTVGRLHVKDSNINNIVRSLTRYDGVIFKGSFTFFALTLGSHYEVGVCYICLIPSPVKKG